MATSLVALREKQNKFGGFLVMCASQYFKNKTELVRTACLLVGLIHVSQ